MDLDSRTFFTLKKDYGTCHIHVSQNDQAPLGQHHFCRVETFLERKDLVMLENTAVSLLSRFKLLFVCCLLGSDVKVLLSLFDLSLRHQHKLQSRFFLLLESGKPVAFKHF